MKRGAPLERQTGLAAKTGLKRGTPLGSRGRMLRHAAQVTVRRWRDTGPTPDVRALVLARDGYCCTWCGGPLGEGLYSLQHRRARGMGGTIRTDANSPANLLAVHGTGTTGCHMRIESEPAAAAASGFRVDQRADPAACLVLIAGRGWCQLDDQGGIEVITRD